MKIIIIKIKLRHFWDCLWVRKDEFHKSLEMNTEYMTGLDHEGVRKYLGDLEKRRRIAHERDLL